VTLISAASSSDIRQAVPMSAEQSPNKLLASLPIEEYQRIAPHLKSVPMWAKQRLYTQDTPIEQVFFPGGGACVLVKTTDDGHAAELAAVGSEGALGMNVYFGLSDAPCDVVVQIASPAETMPVDIFTSEMDRRGSLYDRLVRYSQALMMQIMQTSLCHGLHTAEQRCCRWLLATRDRVGNDEFPFTQEFLATMLGLRRPTVTIVFSNLQAAGVIAPRRGRMRIVNTAGLEAASCECYRVVKHSVSRILPELATSN
jgi:CRP-like cAMP-binding protein